MWSLTMLACSALLCGTGPRMVFPATIADRSYWPQGLGVPRVLAIREHRLGGARRGLSLHLWHRSTTSNPEIRHTAQIVFAIFVPARPSCGL